MIFSSYKFILFLTVVLFVYNILKDLNYKASVTIDDGINIISRDPNSLYGLKRVNRDENITSQDMIQRINK